MSYPPDQHLLRDVPVVTEHLGEGRARARLAVVPELVTASGAVRPGVLAYLVDVLGGGMAAVLVAPDWMATTDLTLHWWRPARHDVTATASLLRRGRNTLVIETELAEDRGAGPDRTPFGRATTTFSILPRRADTLVLPPERPAGASTLALPGSGLDRPVLERTGVRVLDPAAGRAELELDDYVRNSFGALNGGVVVLLAETAAAAAGGARLDGPALARQLTVHYLAQARSGPVRAEAAVLGRDGDEVTCRVAVTDAGAGDRLTAVVTAVVRPDRR